MSSNGDARADKDGITRRDFLDGVAISAAGLAAAAAAPHLTGAEAALASHSRPPGLPPGYNPPIVTGLKGQTDRVLAGIYRIDGKPDVKAAARHSAKGGPGVRVPVKESGEVYDCVIVGAGASGLAAAKFYRDRFGPDAKILLLDPMADFGGHSHRNEFHVPNAAAGGADVTTLRNGGTVNLDSIGAWDAARRGLLGHPGSYGQPALDMLRSGGVDWNNFPSARPRPGSPASFGLQQMLLFAAREFGTDTVAQNRVNAAEPNTPPAGPRSLTGAVVAGRARRDRADPDRHDDRLDRGQARPAERRRQDPATDGDHLQALPEDYVGRPSRRSYGEYQRNSHGLLGAGVPGRLGVGLWLLGSPASGGLGLPDTEDIDVRWASAGRRSVGTWSCSATRPGRGPTATRPCCGWRSAS